MIPYLQLGPAGPLTLPFAASVSLHARGAASVSPESPLLPLPDHASAPTADASPAVVRTRAEDPLAVSARPMPWIIGASAFNWTPEVIRAERAAPDITVGIVADGVASVIEIEPGQLWRSYPESADAEVDALRAGLQAVGGIGQHRRRKPR